MDAIDIEIEKLVYGGSGLGRYDGRAVMTPYVLPGEKLTAEVVRESKRLIQAVPIVVREPAESRVQPLCPVFGACGGCHYQHIPYEQQLDFKTEILRETLARLGKIEWGGEISVVAADPWLYRNRTQFRVARRKRTAEVGFTAAGSHRLVPTPECSINSPKLNEVHARFRDLAQERRFPKFLHEVEFFTNETEVQMNVRATDLPLSRSFFDWCGREIDGLLPGEYIDYASGPDLFRVGSRSFFQVNRFLTDDLARAAVDGESGRSALDLYAGVGLLTLPLARSFERTLGVDSSGAAIRSLSFNAQRAEVDVTAVHLNVDEYLKGLREQVDFVVADPPRAGLGPTVVEELVRIKPERLHLVSCDPSTLARDLKGLTAGGYRIESLTLVDLFPQTFHLETVARLLLG